jgi:hypothetical protein
MSPAEFFNKLKARKKQIAFGTARFNIWRLNGLDSGKQLQMGEQFNLTRQDVRDSVRERLAKYVNETTNERPDLSSDQAYDEAVDRLGIEIGLDRKTFKETFPGQEQ